ncbi:hypothetical protein GQR58_012547 [Nymphon striatum]|nr:hypothetical protein GQR58_012547 [Nymphon striatum]
MPELSIEMSEAIHESVCKYMCALYGKRDFSGTLDQLRCHHFRKKMSDIRSLLPTCDAFRLHLMRCNCQKDQCRSRCPSRKASAPSCTMACRCCGDPLQYHEGLFCESVGPTGLLYFLKTVTYTTLKIDISCFQFF